MSSEGATTFQKQPTQDQGETGLNGPFKVLISAWTLTLLENMTPQQTGRGLVRMVLAEPKGDNSESQGGLGILDNGA